MAESKWTHKTVEYTSGVLAPDNRLAPTNNCLHKYDCFNCYEKMLLGSECSLLSIDRFAYPASHF